MGQKSDHLSVFVPLLKVDEEQRLVYGVMAEEVLDNSNEIFDYDSSKPLFEKWSDHAFNTSNGKSKGNVRTMHGSVAAGKLTDIGFDDAAKRIECCAKVVDDNEWQKVLEGVYTGFSIGGRYAKRWVEKTDDGEKATRYTADPVEVSLVDKPCIPTATFQMIKKDGVVENRLFKTVLGDDTMTIDYNPTNDELVAKATELAKAAGKTDAEWLEFSDAARDQLIEAHLGKASKAKKEDGEDGEPLDGEEREKALEDNAGADEASPDAESKEQAKEEEEDTAAKSDDGDEDDAEKCNEKAEKSDDEDEDDDAMAAEKSDKPGLEQVWKTTDGQTFAKKSEAVAHQKSITDPSLSDLVKKAADKVAALQDTVEKADGDYGDVKYADPGYQADEKPRLPIDTEQHIRASWNHVCKAATAEAYDADQLKRVQNRIVTAWKDTIGEDGPPSVEKMNAFGNLSKTIELTTGEGPLAKGLWEVSRMAHVLEDVACIQSCLDSEAMYEGDGSTVPAKLKDAAASLATIMIEMVTEEVGELVERMKVSNGAVEVEEILAMAADTAGLTKGDFAKAVEISGRDKGRIQKMHDHAAAMGAKCSKAEEAMASSDADMTEKMAKADMADSLSEENAMLKADLAAQRTEMEDAKAMLKSLMVDIEKIKATPMPSAPRTIVVDKGADFGKAEGPMTDGIDLSKMSPDQLADLAIRISQKSGRSML